MNGKDLLDKMSDVDPKLIEDAENSNKKSKTKQKRGMFIGITSSAATVAAAAVLAVAIGRNPTVTPPVTNSGAVSDITSNTEINSGVNSETESSPSKPKDPPVIDFSEYEYLPIISDKSFGKGGQGGNGVHKGDSVTLWELECHSPWSSELDLKTMPVYRSTSTELDLNDLRDYVTASAAALGLPQLGLELSQPGGSVEDNLEALRKGMEAAGLSEDEIKSQLEHYTRVILGNSGVEGKMDGVSLSTMTNYGLSIDFDPAEKLPEGCRLGNNATEEENLAAVKYLTEKYKDLLGYEDPVFTKYGEYGLKTFAVYEGAGDIEDQIFNYSTKYTVFHNSRVYPNGQPDELWRIYTPSNENCIKLDDYPIYTAEQAVEILKSNKYSDDQRMPEDAKILKIDLLYNNAPGYTAVMPYYEIYTQAEGTPSADRDLVCDRYTICAVPDQFIDIENADYGAHAP